MNAAVSALLLILTPAMITTEEGQESYHICDSPVCLKRAQEIKKSLDPCVEPCDDFYSYACGGWMRSHKIPENKASIATFGLLRKELGESLRAILGNMTLVYDDNQNAMDKLAVAYHACLAVPEAGDQREAMLQIMKDSGLAAWPLLPEEKHTRAKDLNWTEVLLNVGLKYILKLTVGRDHRYLTSHVIELDEISFSIVGRDQLIYPNRRYNIPAILAYKKLIVAAAEFMNPSITELQAKVLANDLVDFESKLANLTAPPAEQRDLFEIYHRTSVGALQRNFSEFPLLDLLSKEFGKVNITLTGTEPVEIGALDYYKRLITLLKETEPTTLFNYLGMRTMFTLADDASEDIRNATAQALRVARAGSDRSRWEECVPALIDTMQEVASYVYVTHKFKKEAKMESEEIVRAVKEAFSETLQSSTWMDPHTKRQATMKLEQMKIKIGYPEWILNTTALGELNKYIPKLNSSTPFVLIWRSITENKWKLMLEKLNKPYDPDKVWLASAAVLNAFYSPGGNDMVFPAGILQGVFYEYGLPRSINMGAFGSVAGHEITHGFDFEGSQFDAAGQLRQWWSNATREKFLEKSECFVQQYGKIRDKQTGWKLNGKLTLGENIADNGGLRSAFRAYKKILKEEFNGKDTRLRGLEELSGEKLFFIATAMIECNLYRTDILRARILYDIHSPSMYRINLPMQNMDEFSAVWNCPVHSPMNPDRSKACTLW